MSGLFRKKAPHLYGSLTQETKIHESLQLSVLQEEQCTVILRTAPRYNLLQHVAIHCNADICI